MSAKIMVEHSRKEPGSGEYSSRGFRAFVELEVDASTAASPDRLDAALADAFSVLTSRIDRELESAQPNPQSESQRASNKPVVRKTSGNGHSGRNGGNGRASRITAAQLRCVHALEKATGADAIQVAHEVAGHSDVDRLTVKQASNVIDHLKALQSQPA